MSSAEKVCAVIVAAGTSARLGMDKMFVRLGSKALLARTVSIFEDCPSIDDIVVVLAEANLAKGRKLAQSEHWHKVRAICLGGARRQDSVKAGLRCLGTCSLVVIHDGARPLITGQLIEAGLVAARATGAAVAGVPVKDTVKTVDQKGFVRATLERSALRAIQTPQVFSYELIVKAYDQAGDLEFTDDAALVEAMGHPVLVYPGSYDNIKITTWEDVLLARAILRQRSRGDE